MKTEHMISAQLVKPCAQCISKGQKRETRELVSKRSAMICENITKKQLLNRIFGVWGKSRNALDAMNPTDAAKIRL